MTHPIDHLYPYATGEAGADTRDAVERHLAACPACRADVDTLREMHARLSRLSLERPDASFDGRLRARIAATAGRGRRPWHWAAAGAIAAAATVLLAVSLWMPPAPGNGAPMPDARPLFMVIFQEDVEWRDALDDGALRARRRAFQEWFAELDRQGHVVTGGQRLRDEGGRIVLTGGEVLAPDTSQEILTGFTLLRAADYEEAVSLVRGCPIVTVGRGRVIVRQVSR